MEMDGGGGQTNERSFISRWIADRYAHDDQVPIFLSLSLRAKRAMSVMLNTPLVAVHHRWVKREIQFVTGQLHICECARSSGFTPFDVHTESFVAAWGIQI